MYALLLAQNADETAVLSLVLQRSGLTVTATADSNRAIKAWPEHSTDIVMLALGSESLDFVHRFRALTQVPIIVVTRVDEDLHCELLDAGADWVVPRPFSSRLLIAQIRALLRRTGGVQIFNLPNLDIEGLSLDPATRVVCVVGKPMRRLTHLEFRLLYTLMIHRGQILSTETIVEQVWGYSGKGDKELVRGLVRRLRSKVEVEPSEPAYILTVPGVGYYFQSSNE
ncbi:MAG: response regulator transcription factor [Anaerolineae bacterium]|nr:response regulator transcription factor [Anaerolineae bacterium]